MYIYVYPFCYAGDPVCYESPTLKSEISRLLTSTHTTNLKPNDVSDPHTSDKILVCCDITLHTENVKKVA
jgi:hypothetical protein